MSIRKGIVNRYGNGDLLFGFLVNITKKDLTRERKHPNLSSVYAGGHFSFVIFNNNIKKAFV